jgi:putative oxidoreductase
VDDRPRVARAWASFGLVWLARIVVGAIFAAAALPKVLDLSGFAADIANYRAFPYWSVNLLAGIVPMVELVGAASILTGWKRRGGALMLGALTVGFVVLIASVMVRGIDVGCGCFGSDQGASPVGWPLLVRDGLLLVAIGIAALHAERPPGLTSARR